MIVTLLQTPGTKSNAKYFEIEEYNQQTLMLTNVYNAVISSIDAKPSVKKKSFIKLSKPKDRSEKKKETRVKLSIADRKKMVKIASPVVEESKVAYHIDKTQKIRKCRKNGDDCRASKFDKHFKTVEEAKAFKGD